MDAANTRENSSVEAAAVRRKQRYADVYALSYICKFGFRSTAFKLQKSRPYAGSDANFGDRLK